jgi:microcystin-dependent protein
VGYLTPDSIPADTICRVLFIPNDPAIIAAVTGAINELVYSWNWEEYGTVTPEEMAEGLVDMFDQFSFGEGSCRVIGEIVTFAGASSPDPAWLACDGASYLRADYPDLFAIIGTVYGASDATHFNVPDLSGHVGIGVSGSHSLGTSGGAETVTLTTAEIPSHGHTDTGHLHTVANQGVFLQLAPPVGVFPSAVPLPGVTGLASANITNTGGDGAHNNMQPFLTLNYFIVATQ